MTPRLFRWKTAPDSTPDPIIHVPNPPCPNYVFTQKLSNHDLGMLIAYQRVRIDTLEQELKNQNDTIFELTTIFRHLKSQDQKIDFLLDQHEKSTLPNGISAKSGKFVEWDISTPMVELKPFLKEPFDLQ